MGLVDDLGLVVRECVVVDEDAYLRWAIEKSAAICGLHDISVLVLIQSMRHLPPVVLPESASVMVVLRTICRMRRSTSLFAPPREVVLYVLRNEE